MLAIVARKSGSLADSCVSCNWRGVDQDVSRMSVKVGVMVGDLVSSLVVVLSDVLKNFSLPLMWHLVYRCNPGSPGVDRDASRMREIVLKWVCVPTLEVAEVAVTDVNVYSL